MVRYVLARKTNAFDDCLNAVYAMKHDLQTVINCDIALSILTDSEGLFQVMVKSTVKPEKRLMIDIKDKREAHSQKKISDIGWIRSNGNLADGLTKMTKCKPLEILLNTEKINAVAAQWILRRKAKMQNEF